MSANFLHGVETIEVEKGGRSIKSVKTAVIGLVGTAPIYEITEENQTVNEPTLITSDTDAVKYFGSVKSGYSIPAALDAIIDQGTGIIIVVNVFDPALHNSEIESAAHTFDGNTDTITLAHEGVMQEVVRNAAGTVTYIKDTDYSIDYTTGVITRIETGSITAGQEVAVSYHYADPSKVTAAAVIGAVDVDTGARTGMQALKDSYNLFGFFPKILIAPGYCTQNSVASEMDVLAGKFRAMALIDAPIGTTVAQALAGRGPLGAINFNYSSDRFVPCFPHLKRYDADSDSEVLDPYSARLAGIIASVDNEKGYWWSPSNKNIKGVTGVETKLSAMINDPTCEVNLLNEAGICTVFNSYGTGIRTWGNRTAAWPSVTHPKNFIPVRRTADVIAESIEYSMMQFIDYPINNALIDAVTESVNQFIRTLVGRGAVLDGKCWYDKAKNPTSELALGHITFDYDFMPPTPAERISFESYINTDYLKSLTSGGSAS